MMKRISHILAVLAALCIGVSVLSAGASAVEGIIIGPRTVTYTDPDGSKRVYVEYMSDDISTLAQGSNVILSGMMDYNAAYSAS